jgi:hypothetical protein
MTIELTSPDKAGEGRWPVDAVGHGLQVEVQGSGNQEFKSAAGNGAEELVEPRQCSQAPGRSKGGTGRSRTGNFGHLESRWGLWSHARLSFPDCVMRAALLRGKGNGMLPLMPPRKGREKAR